MTSVKYECDAKNLTGTLVGSKILLAENLTNGALVTPTPVMWNFDVFSIIRLNTLLNQHMSD